MVGATEEEEKLFKGMYIHALKTKIEESIKQTLSGYIGQPATASVLIEPIVQVLAEQKKNETHDLWDMIGSKIRTLPFEDMPLYVNDDNLLTRVTVQWRLKIGK